MTDEEKHLEVMTQLQDLNTKFDEVVKPAVKQTYINKDKITAMNVKIWLACIALGGLVANTVRKLF